MTSHCRLLSTRQSTRQSTRRAASALAVGALAVGALAAAAALAAATPAHAAADVATNVYSADFTDPGTYSWTVPPGVAQVMITLDGAQGGTKAGDSHYGSGGLGAEVKAPVTVHAGQVLTIVVAGAGAYGGGGYGGGGQPGTGRLTGAGGGGASRIVLGEDLLAVAGGGGGAAYGASGGNSEQDGSAFRGDATDGRAGTGAHETLLGSGGAGSTADYIAHCGSTHTGFDGERGEQLVGGRGGGWSSDQATFANDYVSTSGGGGGGGYAGGGGGGTGSFCLTLPMIGYAGGGGGGSSYLDPQVALRSITDGVRSGDGEVRIDAVSTGPIAYPTFEQPTPNGWASSDVTVDWNWAAVAGIDPTRCPQHTSTVRANGRAGLGAVCYDLDGNIARAHTEVWIDRVPPTSTPQVDDHGVVEWHWTDAQSGIDAAACQFDSRGSEPVDGIVTATCSDRAGNVSVQSYAIP